jgi:hypothetical protein
MQVDQNLLQPQPVAHDFRRPLDVAAHLDPGHGKIMLHQLQGARNDLVEHHPFHFLLTRLDEETQLPGDALHPVDHTIELLMDRMRGAVAGNFSAAVR